jgi:transposase
LKGEQESALLKKVIEGTLSLEKYEIMKKRAGLIGIISNLNEKSTLEIFELYKGREEVELAFDSMKNELDADKTYLQTDEGVRGFFFVIFLALRIYFGVLKRLRERKVNQKISVDEVFYELSKIQKIVEKGGRNYFAKAPKRAEDMQVLFADLIPMG